MKRGNTVFTVNQLRRREILSKSMYFVFWILIILDQGDGTTLCTQASESYSLPVSSLCYQTSASANRVVLDGFLTYQSSTNICSCTLTSSKNTTVRFKALANLQPNYFNCGNSIRIQSGGTTFIINCYVSGTVLVSPTQAVTVNFEKTLDGYNSNYCMLIDSDVSDVVLTLKCDGDLNFPSSTLIPSSTLGTRSTTTTLTSKTPTTTGPTTIPRTTTTNPPPTTTATKTLLTTTTTNVMSPVTTISKIRSPLSTTASQIITTKQSETTILVQPSTSSILSQTIPAIGTGLVLICVIVLVVCFRYRRKSKKPSNDRPVVYVNEIKINLPYSPDNKYEERSSEIMRESSTHIYDVIL